MPRSMNRQVYDSKNNEYEQIFKLRNSFSNSFNGEVSNVTDLDDSDSIKYEVLSGLKNKVSDKVGNINSGFIGKASPELEEVNQTEGFNTKASIDISKGKVGGKGGKGFNLFCIPSFVQTYFNKAVGLVNSYEIGSGNRFIGAFSLGRCPNTYIIPFESLDMWGEVKLIVPYGNTTKMIRLQPIKRKTIKVTDLTLMPYGFDSIWYGSVRESNQTYNQSQKFDDIYNSGDAGKDSINNTFAGAPFATKGTGKLIAELNFEKSQIGYRDHTHIEYYFDIKNEHPDYNNKFSKTNRNPYQKETKQYLNKCFDILSNSGSKEKYCFSFEPETEFHIRERHDLGFLNASEFINVFNHKNGNTKMLYKFKGSKSQKGDSWNISDMRNNATRQKLFKQAKEISEMTDIYDKWTSKKTNFLVIEGVRNGRYIGIQMDKPDYHISSSFPSHDKNSEDNYESDILNYYNSISEDGLIRLFNYSLRFDKLTDTNIFKSEQGNCFTTSKNSQNFINGKHIFIFDETKNSILSFKKDNFDVTNQYEPVKKR